jgi:hypothetical protein
MMMTRSSRTERPGQRKNACCMADEYRDEVDDQCLFLYLVVLCLVGSDVRIAYPRPAILDVYT